MKTLFIQRRTVVMLGLLGLCAAFVWISMSNTHDVDSSRAQLDSRQSASGTGDNKPADDREATTGVKDGSILGEEFTGSALADMIAQNEKNGSEFYSEYRLQRDRIRSQQIDLLREIVNNPNSAQETRQDAQQKLIAITQNLEREMELENLIIAKGFEDAVVLIQPSAVTVIVQGRTLPQDQIAKITDLAVRSLKIRAEDIVIIPKP